MFYTILIVITLVSLTISIIISIIEKRELRAQRTDTFKTIKEATQKLFEKTISVPKIKQEIDVLDLTHEINTEEIKAAQEESPKIIKIIDEDITT